jgi:hypothetical protein
MGTSKDGKFKILSKIITALISKKAGFIHTSQLMKLMEHQLLLQDLQARNGLSTNTNKSSKRMTQNLRLIATLCLKDLTFTSTDLTAGLTASSLTLSLISAHKLTMSFTSNIPAMMFPRSTQFNSVRLIN